MQYSILDVMNILVISASSRKESQSVKVSKWLVEKSKTLGFDSNLLDLYKMKLPMYDDGETVPDNKNELLEKLSSADGFVFVSPEWNGMVNPSLLNMLHYVDREMADKPVMLVGVSSTRGGAYPVSQMRSMGHKNRHYVITPEVLIVRDAEDIMNSFDSSANKVDEYIQKRAEYALKVLHAYAEALDGVRKSGVIDLDNYPNGM